MRPVATTSEIMKSPLKITKSDHLGLKSLDKPRSSLLHNDHVFEAASGAPKAAAGAAKQHCSPPYLHDLLAKHALVPRDERTECVRKPLTFNVRQGSRDD